MYIRRIAGPRSVTLPDGTRMTRADLPPQDTRRWVASRKARVVLAVNCGLIQREEALQLYDLSEEEFEIWCEAARRHGEAGLKVTKIQALKGDQQL
ncbi:DUF1153 domain-containing protein [Halodurantibacterium flavum]|uniref:DUF1153 domain-containing protein n=1 Tax=Halodurantibacterium flavum TaxID=1382802 RepID=A0ABW4SAM4_9RHOB